MDKEKDEIIINETESVVEPARPEPATEPKPKKRVCLGILLSVLGILLVGGALALGYLWGTNAPHATDSNTQSISSKTDNENTTEPENNKTETATAETTEPFKPLTFNTDAIVNGDANQRYFASISGRIGDTDGGAGYTLDAFADSNSGYNKVNVQVRWSSINKYYGTNHSIPGGSSVDDHEYFEVNFSQPVTDIYIGGIGQAIGHESIFYLMEDGTVEKTDVRAAAEAGDFTSHTKIDGLEKIVKFYDVDAGFNNNGAGGYRTSAAQDIDGKIYLLFK